jgi:putative FmdB family regulatory protein
VPIYEYQCAECNKVFEAFQKINDDPLTECKFCKGKVEQIISQTSFQFKGGGWYVTDYAKKSTGSKTDAPKSDGAEKSSESKSDSAPKSSENSSGGKASADKT